MDGDRSMRTLVGLLVSACAPAIVQDAPRVDLDAVKRRAAEQPMTFADVSPVALVARPSDFDGMKIRVIGFAVFEFERHALFPWESERRMLNAANGIWIEAPTKYVLGGFPLEAFDGKHIVVAVSYTHLTLPTTERV